MHAARLDADVPTEGGSARAAQGPATKEQAEENSTDPCRADGVLEVGWTCAETLNAEVHKAWCAAKEPAGWTCAEGLSAEVVGEP